MEQQPSCTGVLTMEEVGTGFGLPGPQEAAFLQGLAETNAVSSTEPSPLVSPPGNTACRRLVDPLHTSACLLIPPERMQGCHTHSAPACDLGLAVDWLRVQSGFEVDTQL